MDIQGRLAVKMDEQTVSEKFKKREFVIETGDKYPELLKFQLVNDKTDLLEPYKIGETIKVTFNLKGAKWKESYFVNLQAWKIERIGPTVASVETPKEETLVTTNDSQSDVLPF